MQFLLNTPNLLHIDGEKKLSFIVQCAFLRKMTTVSPNSPHWRAPTPHRQPTTRWSPWYFALPCLAQGLADPVLGFQCEVIIILWWFQKVPCPPAPIGNLKEHRFLTSTCSKNKEPPPPITFWHLTGMLLPKHFVMQNDIGQYSLISFFTNPESISVGPGMTPRGTVTY